MHNEILSPAQADLLPLVGEFKDEFCLVGGTAVALYLGHRRSIDFDLFKHGALHPKRILDMVKAHGLPVQVTRRVEEQLNLLVNGVKLTFIDYPFPIPAPHWFENIISLPDLLTLAAMKAYALGGRAKWKDYVDLYFILKSHYALGEIVTKANALFGELFSEKQFRAQLCYFKDIDSSESLEYVVPAVADSDIQEFLVEQAIDVL